MDSMTIYKHDYFLNQPEDHHILYEIFEIGAFLAKCQCMHNGVDEHMVLPKIGCATCFLQPFMFPQNQFQVLFVCSAAQDKAGSIQIKFTSYTSQLRSLLCTFLRTAHRILRACACRFGWFASGSRHLWLIGTWSVRRGLLQGQHMWCETWAEKTSCRWCNRVIRKGLKYIFSNDIN